jgi:alpha-tubulin suppressor-like RCC1 family protein
VGDNEYGQCNVGNWTNIVQVAAGYGYTVGLRSDGTVVAVGNNDYGQCNVGNWTDIVEVAAGIYHTAGVKSDGTVLVAGDETELAKWHL